MSLDKPQYPYVKISGKYYSLDEVLIALGKVLIKKGILTKAEVIAEL